MGHEYFEWQVTPPVSCLYVIYWTVDAESVHTNGKMLGGGFHDAINTIFPTFNGIQYVPCTIQLENKSVRENIHYKSTIGLLRTPII